MTKVDNHLDFDIETIVRAHHMWGHRPSLMCKLAYNSDQKPCLGSEVHVQGTELYIMQAHDESGCIKTSKTKNQHDQLIIINRFYPQHSRYFPCLWFILSSKESKTYKELDGEDIAEFKKPEPQIQLGPGSTALLRCQGKYCHCC